MCGGTSAPAPVGSGPPGLSPRVRGNLGKSSQPSADKRSIPACAGEPPGLMAWVWSGGVYPRVCGGTALPQHAGGGARGLSPRVRGNPFTAKSRPVIYGSIPACAGEPVFWGRPSIMRRVYPRVCGGTRFSSRVFSCLSGLSPRVRGNPPPRPRRLYAHRSIPACAGEPQGARPPPYPYQVYPRVCGGTSASGKLRSAASGLSPRVRGNP